MGSQWDFGECRNALERFSPLPCSCTPNLCPGDMRRTCEPGRQHSQTLFHWWHLHLHIAWKEREPMDQYLGFFIKILLYQVECYSNLGIGWRNETARFMFKYLKDNLKCTNENLSSLAGKKFTARKKYLKRNTNINIKYIKSWGLGFFFPLS